MSILILILLLTQKMGISDNTKYTGKHTPGFYTLSATRLNREHNAIVAQRRKVGPQYEYNLALMHLINKYTANPRTKNKVMNNVRTSQNDLQNVLSNDIANSKDREFLKETAPKNSAYSLLNDTIDFLHTQAHRSPITRPFYNLAFLMKNYRAIRAR